MRILVTNDDGIRAPGLLALYEALVLGTPQFPGGLGGASTTHESCMIVAPLTVQSATSHGITFHEPLMTREEQLVLPTTGARVSGVAVDGRPADCVKLAISAIWPARAALGALGGKPDVIISGMNAGANCGINVIYSGTVAAAIEGAFLGIPSIAVSLRLGTGRPRYDLAAARARAALEAIFAAGGPQPYEVLNVNIPATEDPASAGTRPDREQGAQSPAARGSFTSASRASAIPGAVGNIGVLPPLPVPAHEDPRVLPQIRVCPMNTHGLIDRYEERSSPGGDRYFWAAGHGLDFHATEAGSDVDLLMQGHTTITPLKFDLTRHEAIARWRRIEAE